MPSAISVNMLSLRLTSDRQPRTKNGQPAQSTTGVASTSCSQFDVCCPIACVSPSRCPPISRTKHRNGQHQADPEPPRHIDELRARPRVGCRHHRLQRHAADRARARPRLPHLRVHRAGVDGALGRRLLASSSPVPARDSATGRLRIFAGSRPSRNRTCARRASSGAVSCADRPSCRTPDPSGDACRTRRDRARHVHALDDALRDPDRSALALQGRDASGSSSFVLSLNRYIGYLFVARSDQPSGVAFERGYLYNPGERKKIAGPLGPASPTGRLHVWET